MRFQFAIVLVLLSSPVWGADSAATIWNLDTLSHPPEYQWIDSDAPIRSLTFTGPVFKGKPTDVFAFYATPGSLRGVPDKEGQLPAVVLLHGGGGTAFAEWVNLWAKRGYAAIALDFSGRRPSAPEFDPNTRELIVQRDHRKIIRERLPHGGPEHTGIEKFENVGGDITDDWQYHAISNIILAHSLIRSFSEVDAERTAVTGISWGGYLTCIAASVDHRFKAAVPVYGCGYLYEGESVQKPQIDRLPDDKRADWIKMYDPSKHLVNCRVPILFVNGTNDVHYPLDSYMKSYHAVPGEKNLRIEVKMGHSHPAGWAPDEIERFIASQINQGQAIAKIERPRLQGRQVTANYTSSVPIANAQLHWTTDSGLLSKRNWMSAPAEIKDNSSLIAPQPPQASTIWYFTATDEQNAMISSEVVFTN